MATLRQVADDGKNPRLGLEIAKQVLPEIEKEEQFGEARGELATILPDIADGFATQATQTQDAARKGELVKLASEALTLVNNPAYLPASMRKDREGHILRIVDKLRAAERNIQQEQDLVAVVKKIGTATEKGDAAAAYQLHTDLLRVYPGLAANAQLVAAIRRVGEKEQQLVSTSASGSEPVTTDSPAASETVVISYREKSAAAASGAQPVFVLIEGSVYGIEAPTGRVLWRRFVGYETTNQPLAVTSAGANDVLLIDGRREELVRLKGTTGELVWRQKIGGDALGPVPAGNRILITTRKGVVASLDAATGRIAATAQLPQGAQIAPAVRQSRVYQLGEHSTLFVLDANSLACVETVYLGHRTGELLVPPVVVLDQLLVIRSPADDYSEIQVLGPDAKSKRLAPFSKPKRLKGRIVTPLSVSAARVAAVTDLGQVAVYEVDPAGASEHLRLLAGVDATEGSPREIFCELNRNNLWVANRRSELFEVQSSLSQLARRWAQNHDDVFLGPLQLQGDILVQVRRRSGVAGILVEGCRGATSGDAVWTTHLAAPVLALVPRESRQAIDCLTAEGRLYSIGAQLAARQIDEAKFSPRGGGIQIFDDVARSADEQTLVWTESGAIGRAYVYDARSGRDPVAISLPATAAAPAIPLGSDIAAPLTSGAVVLVNRAPTADKPAPFMPPLVPDALPLWTKPAALADGKTFLISDGRSAVYAVTKRDGAKPQLAALGEPARTADPVSSPLVLAGSSAYGIVHQPATDALAGFDSRGAALFEPVPLEGRVQSGPFAVGGLVFVFAEPDGLVCFSGDGRVRWQQPPDRGILAGPPLACPDGDLLVMHQSGLVCRLDAATGNTLAQHDIGEPLLGPACLLGTQVYLAGSDGVIHRIALPTRP
jgi:outer membrane protein assembly factor BamB